MNDKLSNLAKTYLARIFFHKVPNSRVWVFSSTANKAYNYNSRYLFEYVKENCRDITPYFVINDDQERERLGRKLGADYFIETKTFSGIRKVLEAGVWFTSAGMPLYGANLQKNRIVVNLWHGVPLKRIVLLENHWNRFKKLYFKKIFSDNYTYVVTTSPHLVPIMAESFGMPKERIVVWGQPRNDRLLEEAGTKTGLPLDFAVEYQKILFYAPTYREGTKTKLFPFPDFNQEQLEDYLEQNQLLLLIHTHISESGEFEEFAGKRVLFPDFEDSEDVMGLLKETALLITDYSSIYIDYLLLQRPMVFLPYDKEEYQQERGFNFSYDKVTPGPKPESFQEFLKEISRCLEDEKYYQEERQELNHYFNQIQEPCCQLICDRIREKEEEIK